MDEVDRIVASLEEWGEFIMPRMQNGYYMYWTYNYRGEPLLVTRTFGENTINQEFPEFLTDVWGNKYEKVV